MAAIAAPREPRLNPPEVRVSRGNTARDILIAEAAMVLGVL